ncbi:MAG: hypothetical protein Q4P13_07945 [Psychrobacter sp.]|nr:hypothetical protein [Psychrobacter sp.]
MGLSGMAHAETTTQTAKYCQLATLTADDCSTYQAFQADADIVRLQHLYYWTRKIYDYKQKTGKFPFEGESTQPILVEIATPEQQQTINRPPNVPKSSHTVADLVKILSSVTPNEPFYELYDPQYAPDVKPNFYIYMIDGDTFYFAIHTHQAYPFARQVGPDYYKVEVSNVYDPRTKYILRPEMLFESQAYEDAVKAHIQKPDFFAQREELSQQASQKEK